jgi:hypothetical protein
MLFTLDFVVNPIVAAAALFIGGFIGFIWGKGKLIKKQSEINRLESEMISSHAEILEMQKAYVKMESRLKELSIPVIPMKINGKENSKETATK